MTDVVPPDNRALGQTGHIGDHNNIADVLTALQASTAATPQFQTGTAALVAGTVTVPNTTVVSGSLIFLSRQQSGGTPGTLTWSVSSGVSFTIVSSSATDTSAIAWMLVTPA